MDFIKFSRGHFFGVIIPGIFLFFNIVLINNELIAAYINDDIVKKFGSSTPYFVTVFLILSYIIGILIRLLRPSPLEKLAFPIHWSILKIDSLFKLLWKGIKTIIKRIFKYKTKNKPNDKNNTHQAHIKQNAVDRGEIKEISNSKFYYQEFPYLYWFFGTYLNKVGYNYRKFYLETILLGEFKDNINTIRTKNFFNNCKIYLLEKSKNISEEILYNEGLSRFISGLIYSFIISIIMVIPQFEKFETLFYIYVGLLLFSLYQLRSVRIKEMLAIFDAYMMIRSEEVDKSNKEENSKN